MPKGGKRKGAGRKPLSLNEQTVTVAVRMPASWAAMMSGSRSEYIRRLVELDMRERIEMLEAATK